MTPSAFAQLRALTLEALRDAVRRRTAAAFAVLALLSLLVVDNCTACGTRVLIVNGSAVGPVAGRAMLGWAGMVLYAVLALWTVAISGALASDHLQQTLDDGSAHLTLARPVGRGVFALSRLFGALAVSLGTGTLLLGGAAFFLRARYGLGFGPAAVAAAVTALGSVSIAAIAMTASLYLPRLATVAAVFLGVAAIAAANVASVAGSELSAVWSLVDRFAPPIGSGLALAVGAWSGREIPVSPPLVALRLALWSLFAPALLAFAFRRREI